MTTPKLSPSDIIDICDSYRCDDYLDSLDRAELSRHFGGGRIQIGSDNLGLVSDNNWQLGHKFLNRAYRQIFSIATSDAGLAAITVKRSLNPQRRRFVERYANKIVNKVIRESRSFRFAYSAACGDAVLYGTPYLYRWDLRSWLPKYAGMPLLPRGAPSDVNDDQFCRWAFPGTLSAREIMGMLKQAKRAGKSERWNVSGLRDALKALYQEKKPENEGILDTHFDQNDPEHLEYELQSNSWGVNTLQGAIKVYYFFQKDDKGRVDCWITNRHGEKIDSFGGDEHRPPSMRIHRKDGKSIDRHLFYQPARFKVVNETLWPLILDTKFGGKCQVHRAHGLGRLNYDLDVMVSRMVNHTNAGIMDEVTPLYQAVNGTSTQRIDQLMASGVRWGSVFPEGVKAFERPNNSRNYGMLMQMMSFLDIGQGANAASHALGANQSKGPRELEVQALERQSQNQQDITSRMQDWVDMATPMVQEMIKTLIHRPVLAGDRGYDDRQKLIKLLGERGIRIEELGEDLIEVSMRKHLGAGDAQLALQRAQEKVRNLHLFPAESHPMVIREWVAALDDSQERADELIPHAQKPDPSQIRQAEVEEAVALTSGVVPPVQAATVPDIHLQSHLQKVANIVQQNQQSGIDMVTANGIAALLEHSMAEARLIEIRGQSELFKQYDQAIKQLAAAAQEITKVPPPPKEVFDMRIKERQQSLQEQKRLDAVEKNVRSQDHREDIDAQKIAINMNDSARKDRELALKEEQALAATAQSA